MLSNCPPDVFAQMLRTLGPSATARKLKISERAVYMRKQRMANAGIDLTGPARQNGITRQASSARIECEVKNGIILVGSDAHIWPGERSTAMRAFIYLTKVLKPKIVVLNGDVLDFSRISRHSRIGWETTPQVHEEIEAAQDILHDLEQAAGKGVRKLWPIGNHDARFETRLANQDPEYAMINGVHLSDHFPNWEKCWSVGVNDDILIKHRFKGGLHATHNNAMWAGKTVVTGHLHSQRITPFTDDRGTRYGIDTGCLADVKHRAFIEYTEDNPLNWRSGFGVLTIKDGELLPPELVTVWKPKQVVFRGEVITV